MRNGHFCRLCSHSFARSRQQRFFSLREEKKVKRAKRPLNTSLGGAGPNVSIIHCLIHGHERRRLLAPRAYYTKFNDLYGDVYHSST